MSTQPPSPNRAGIVCFNRAGEVLVCTSLGKDSIWVFPKGHIEPNESSWEAAERECREEAGIDAIVDTTEPIGTTTYDYLGEKVVVDWFGGLARGVFADPNGTETEWGFRTAKWVKWEAALDLLSFPDLRNILRRALCLPEEPEGVITITATQEEFK